MKIEFYLNEAKAKILGVEVDQMYEELGKVCLAKGLAYISKGIYGGDDSDKTFDAIFYVFKMFPETNFFIPCVEDWFWTDVPGMPKRIDCLSMYARILSEKKEFILFQNKKMKSSNKS